MMAMAVRPTVGEAPRECAGKVKYLSQLAAADGLIRLANAYRSGELRNTSTRPLNLYECSHCGCWHVGHRPEFV